MGIEDWPLWQERLQAKDRYFDRRAEGTAKDRGTRSAGAKLALLGHAKGLTLVDSDRLPHCDDPQRIHRITDPKAPARTLEVNFWAPCRKCAKCLQFRQMKWRERALVEIMRGNRTWFVTLTFSPVHLTGITFEAAKERGSDALSRLEKAAYRHVQRYFKRLRKEGAVFRYLAVFEQGEQNGRPHYHLLLHETGERPILKRTIEGKWRRGSHVHCRLVAKEADGAASYVTKYATKSASVRLRASQRYGALPDRPRSQKHRF